MPEMIDVASHFDDIEAIDAYTGEFAFMAQFNTHDESSIDGATERKRSMSVRPGTVMPARRVLTVFGESWIIGDGNSDGLANTAIRKAYWLKRADPVATLHMPKQLLDGLPGLDMHVNKVFLKDVVNQPTDAEYDPFWEFYVAKDEPVRTGYIFELDGELFRVRAQHVEISGFRVASCDQLDIPFSTLTGFINRTYDPVTQESTGVSVTVPCITVDAYKMYSYNSTLVPKIGPGDLMCITSTQFSVGTPVEHGLYGSYLVHAVREEVDGWAHHLVKA